MRKKSAIRILGSWLLPLLMLIPAAASGEVSAHLTEVRTETEDGYILTWTLDGVPTAAEDKGYCSARNTVENGRTVRTEYYDERGELTRCAGGYAVMEKTVDPSDQSVYERYYDENGQPAKRATGQYGIHHQAIDENGCVTRLTYIDENGDPFMISGVYSTLLRTFDENGRVLTEMYCTPDGEPVIMRMGHSGYRYLRDEEGDQIGAVFLDRDGQPMINHQGYGMVLYEYDDWGNTVKETYYNREGRPVALSRGQYGQIFEYEKREKLRSCYIDAEGKELILADQYLGNHPAAVILAALGLLALTLLLPRRFRWGLLGLYVLFILYMTLMTRVAKEHTVNLRLFRSWGKLLSDPDTRSDLVNNLLLFIPLGALIRALKPKWIWMAAALSLVIEIIQYLTGLGLCDIDDLFANTLGSGIGFFLMAAAMKLQMKIKKKKP